MKHRICLFMAALVLLAATVGHGFCDTIIVKSDGTGDYATIQDAIDNATAGDEVVLQPGNYTGDGNRDISFGGKAITVRGTDPDNLTIVAATIIDCQGSYSDPHRGFYFHDNETDNSALSGLTVTNGYADDGGGGVSCWNSSPTISNCIITGNQAGIVGGGVSCWNSSPTISNCTISGNQARFSGGGVACYSSSPTITNCILWGDAAGMAGPEIALASPNYPWPYLSTLTVGYSDIQGGQAAAYVEDNCILNWQAGNTEDNPLFADPGYWDDDSGDFWVDGDYHLKSTGWRWEPAGRIWTWDNVTSRCIDGGNPGCDPSDEWPFGCERINMGAYGGTDQASVPPHNWANIADINNDRIVNWADFSIFTSYWSEQGQCIPADLNRDQIVDWGDFSMFASQWLWCTDPANSDCDQYWR